MRQGVFIPIALVMIILSGCGWRPAPVNAPTLSPSVPTFSPSVPTSSPNVPTLPPDAAFQVLPQDVFCATENEHARQFYNDARNIEEQGNLEDAERLYRKAIELDPGFCDAMDNLGRLFRSQGKVDEAISWYKKSIEILPSNSVAHVDLAAAYRVQGKMEDAMAEYQQVVQIDPDNPEGYYGLGMLYLDLERPQDAVLQLEKAEELYAKQPSPFITDARFLLGLSYLMLGKCGKATDHLELIYPGMQDDPDTNYFLGLCYYLCPETENLELAKSYVKKAQELGKDIPADLLQKLGIGK